MPLRLRRIVSSGWIPAALALAVHILILQRFEVPTGAIVRYGLWLIWGVALPGTIVWRSLRGTPRSFVEDVACGSALGFAMEILVYIAARYANVPILIVAWPALVIVAFSARPKMFRRWWRAPGSDRAPAGWAWAMAFLVVVINGWMAIRGFRTQALSGVASQYPYVDLPYHLALATEIKNHMPPTWPYVLGDALHHHWFAHAEMAASGWATGIDLRLILLRLQLFPMMTVTVLVTALAASRLTRRWWPGPFAVLFGFLVSGVMPYAWAGGWLFDEHRLLADFFWESPSSLVAAPLFGAVAILMIDRLRRAPAAFGQWTLIVTLLGAAMGTKSTTMPLFIAGALFVAGLELLFRFRISKPARTAIFIGLPLFVFASYVLYGGQSYGLSFKPLDYIRFIRGFVFLHLTKTPNTPLPTGPAYAVAGLSLLSWLGRGSGALGLMGARDRGMRRPAAFMAGIAIAGICGPLLFTHPGFSELYFLRSAMPMIGILGAAGIAALVPRARRAAHVALPMMIAVGFGGLIAYLVGLAFKFTPTREWAGGRPEALIQLAKPFLIIVVLLIQMAVLFALLARRVRWIRGIGAAMVLAMAAGTGLPVTVRDLSDMAGTLMKDGLGSIQLPSDARPIPEMGLVAARWLRDHSGINDIIATNSHCRMIADYGGCDNRHFWISAYTERRVLVEGWGYTEQAIAISIGFGPFFDLPRLAYNDLAFTDPNSATIGGLKLLYGVRWLFVDERYDRPSDDLIHYATVRFRAGPCVVYEI